MQQNDSTKLTFQLPMSANGDVPEVIIHVPNRYWMGKVQPGEYFLETPYCYARSQMLPLPAVSRLINEGELPHVNFRKEPYVLRSFPVFRSVSPIDGSDESFI
jgi:hypothetical protein